MTVKFEKLKKTIIKCNKCPRLVKFRKKISTEKRKQYMNQTYWGKPVTGFGDINGKIMIVGLAPAAHGGTRTGRVFTGDKSSDFLYKCLHNVKIANQSNSDHVNDGLKIKNTFITPALKCVPPGDKPLNDELKNCFGYFKSEFEILKNLKIIVALGKIAFRKSILDQPEYSAMKLLLPWYFITRDTDLRNFSEIIGLTSSEVRSLNGRRKPLNELFQN